MRISIAISVLALLLACGGSDSGQDSAGSAETPPVAAASGAGAPTPAAPSAPAAAEPEPSTDPQVQGCLDLVGDAHYQKAVPVCLAALKNDPHNQQVKSALAQAQTQTASAADAAEAAAGAAADSARADASSKLGEATGGVKLGQ